MAISPISFSTPVTGLREMLDRSLGGQGASAFPKQGGQPLPGAAARFAEALKGAVESGGPDALNLLSQSSLGTQFMSAMGGVDAAKAAELGEVNMLLDALSGSGSQKGGGNLDLLGILGAGAIPGGMGGVGGVDMSKVAEALKSSGIMSGGTGGQQSPLEALKAAMMPSRVSGPGRVDGPRRMDTAQAAVATEAMGARPRPEQIVSAARENQQASPLRMKEVAASETTSPTLNLAKTAMARRAYGKAEAHAPKPDGADVLGALSSRFESGGNTGAVGYDRVGGTSYGEYQISSRAGTFDMFLKYLDKNAPDMASRLRAAGPANTGSTAGPMPSAWKTLAHEEPGRFSKLQHDFINESHFKPALRKIAENSGIDLTDRHQAIAQVLWSTAVQHGATGSARIFSSALGALRGMADGPGFEKNLIEQVYARRSGQFGSSTERVQHAVKGRFSQEMKAALSMLDGMGELDLGA